MQTLHLVGLNQEQLDLLQKKGYAVSVDSGISLLHITVTKNIANHLTEIGQVLSETQNSGG